MRAAKMASVRYGDDKSQNPDEREPKPCRRYAGRANAYSRLESLIVTNFQTGEILMQNTIERAEAQTPTPAITYDDGDLIIRLRTEDLETGERLTKGTPNGVQFAKFAYSQTQTELERGGGFSIVDENGNVRTAKKFSIVMETVDGTEVERKRTAKFFRNVVASIKRRTGITKTKKPVPASERLELADLRQWINGGRQLDGFDFTALPDITQDKVMEIVEKLANPNVKASPLPSSVAALAELWDDGVYDFALEHGKVSQAKYDSLKRTVEAHKKRLADKAAKEAAEAAKAV